MLTLLPFFIFCCFHLALALLFIFVIHIYFEFGIPNSQIPNSWPATTLSWITPWSYSTSHPTPTPVVAGRVLWVRVCVCPSVGKVRIGLSTFAQADSKQLSTEHAQQAVLNVKFPIQVLCEIFKAVSFDLHIYTIDGLLLWYWNLIAFLFKVWIIIQKSLHNNLSSEARPPAHCRQENTLPCRK